MYHRRTAAERDGNRLGRRLQLGLWLEGRGGFCGGGPELGGRAGFCGGSPELGEPVPGRQ
jgi:hypothetical protein